MTPVIQFMIYGVDRDDTSDQIYDLWSRQLLFME